MKKKDLAVKVTKLGTGSYLASTGHRIVHSIAMEGWLVFKPDESQPSDVYGSLAEARAAIALMLVCDRVDAFAARHGGEPSRVSPAHVVGIISLLGDHLTFVKV